MTLDLTGDDFLGVAREEFVKSIKQFLKVCEGFWSPVDCWLWLGGLCLWCFDVCRSPGCVVWLSIKQFLEVT